MSENLSAVRFPGESETYRAARNELLVAEIALRRQMEAVAEQRRSLPPGGEVREDYRFDERGGKDGSERPVRLSELFAEQKDTLVLYSFMFSEQMKQACASCTSIIDSLDGEAPHILQRVNLAVVAKSPIARIEQFARERGWRNVRLLSSAHSTYNRDYHAENDTGAQMPILNVFVRRYGRIYHSYATELLYAPRDPGQDFRHVDSIWPLWNVFDMTPDGRGGKWSPRLSY